MILKFNSQRILQLPSGKVLIPGINKHDDELWEKDKEDSIIQLKIDEEEIVEIGTDENGNGIADSVEPLLKLSEAKALKFVKETGDRELLKLWHDKESKVKVKLAIEAQLKEIANIEYRKKEEEKKSE